MYPKLLIDREKCVQCGRGNAPLHSFMKELLTVREHDRVLEIGFGAGKSNGLSNRAVTQFTFSGALTMLRRLPCTIF